MSPDSPRGGGVSPPAPIAFTSQGLDLFLSLATPRPTESSPLGPRTRAPSHPHRYMCSVCSRGKALLGVIWVYTEPSTAPHACLGSNSGPLLEEGPHSTCSSLAGALGESLTRRKSSLHGQKSKLLGFQAAQPLTWTSCYLLWVQPCLWLEEEG